MRRRVSGRKTPRVGISAAQAADVTSANIVGYTTVTLKQGYNMIALNFENIGENATIDIQDLIPGTTEGLTAAAASANADKIQIYNSALGEYTSFSLYVNPRNASDAKNNKWVGDGNVLANYAFHDGDAFWFYKRGTGDVNVAFKGQVSAASSATISIVNGYNMIGSAFPANFNPNSLGAEFWKNSGAVAAAASANADKIQVYDSTSGEYTSYSLYVNPRNSSDAKNYKWVADGNVAVDSAANFVPPAKGAWYVHKGQGFTLIINTPVPAE